MLYVVSLMQRLCFPIFISRVLYILVYLYTVYTIWYSEYVQSIFICIWGKHDVFQNRITCKLNKLNGLTLDLLKHHWKNTYLDVVDLRYPGILVRGLKPRFYLLRNYGSGCAFYDQFSLLWTYTLASGSQMKKKTQQI